MAGRLRIAAAVLVLMAAGLLGAMPAGAVTPQQELRIGRRVGAELEGRYGRLDDPERLARVMRIGRRLEAAAGLKPGTISFHLLDNPDFNAFTIPGNMIYVMRGLVDQVRSDDELAAALAHEISHITLGHVRQLLQDPPTRHAQISVERVLPDGSIKKEVITREVPEEETPASMRRKELEADAAALPLLRKAGYPPRAALGMLEHLVPPADRNAAKAGRRSQHGRDVLSTHPTAAQRLRQVRAYLRAHGE